ncbi:uncharacterized protein [Watersipora subatra]|uniref:uncharacterized protein isoform X2 n=1 Tax=Watersipora subatra TaxID=2589382 RepID=UPI00355B6358
MAKVVNFGFDTIKDASSALSSSIRSGFGTNFQHTVISTSTGRVLITNQGIQILKVLELKSPIYECVMTHIRAYYDKFGDCTKSFLLLLNELLIQVAHLSGNPTSFSYFQEKDRVAQRVKLCQEIDLILAHTLNHLFTLMSQYCLVSDMALVTHDSSHHIVNLIAGYLKTHLADQEAFYLGSLSVQLIEAWRKCKTFSSVDSVVHHLLKNKNYILHENVGQSLSASALFPGYLLSRGFCRFERLQNSKISVNEGRFVLLSCPLDSDATDGDNIAEYSLHDNEGIDAALYHKRVRASKFLELITRLGVQLIISVYQLSTTDKDLCQQHNMHVIHALPEDELEFLSRSCNKAIVYDINDLAIDNVCPFSKCNEITFGTVIYSHLIPKDAPGVHTLVLGAPTEGIAHQLKDLISSSLKAVRSSLVSRDETQWMNSSKNSSTGVTRSRISKVLSKSYNSTDPPPEYLCTIAVGGTFELVLHHIIDKHLQELSVISHGVTMLTILRDSLLCIPQLLHENAYGPAKPRWLETLTVAKNRLHQGDSVGVDAVEGTITTHSETESFHSKCQLIVEVLIALRQFLHLQSAI